MDKNFDIKDDEFRIIGKPVIQEVTKIPKRPFKWYHICIIAIVSIIAIGLIAYALTGALISGVSSADNAANEHPIEIGIFDSIPQPPAAIVKEAMKQRLGNYKDSVGAGYTEKLDTVINDIPLDIFIPHNANAELCLRTPDINDPNIIFCAQAADIRRDNKKIVGAFVLKGKPLTWGLSKKGYCAIIDNRITVGVADNSPLFEEATEKGGYFFRQYPLVDNGTLVENEPKNKSIRKALCDRNDEIIIVVSKTPESFHDFAQALVDLGVDNAIYLVGSEYAKGWYRDANQNFIEFSKGKRDRYLNENYIVWR